MKNNDISNRGAMCILIRVEDFLLEYKNNNVWDKFANMCVGKEARAELNENVVALINMIFRGTDLTADLAVDRKNYNEFVIEKIEALPYGRLIKIDKPVQISTKLNTGEYAYYVDSNPERISQVGNKRAISLEEINTYLRGGYRFE